MFEVAFTETNFLDRIWVDSKRETKVLKCSQVSYNAHDAPLLPPDLIHESKDISYDSTPRSTCFDNPSLARSEYKRLQLEKSSVRRHRKFVFGAIYHRIFPGYFEVDPRLGNFDIVVQVSSIEESIIRIRLVSPEYKGADGRFLLSSLVELGKNLRGPGNARGCRVGDVGSMHAFGYKSASTKDIYKGTDELASKIKTASTTMSNWMEDNMRDELKKIMDVDTELKIAKVLPCMPRGPGSRMMISVNLGNSPHYDVGDSSKSVAVWVEEKPGQSKNWYFILPNLSHQGSKGMIVKLAHGVVISWDARNIYHCTSKTEVGSNNKTYGCMWGSSRI